MENLGCIKLAITRRVCCHVKMSVPLNLLMVWMSWVVNAVGSMMNADVPAHLFSYLRYMRMNLCRTGSWRKSSISDRRRISKGDPRKKPINVANLEECRCRCDMLITREAHDRNTRTLVWNDISERCSRSAQSGGKIHWFGRRDRSLEKKVALKWPRKTTGMRAWGQPTSTSKVNLLRVI